LEFFVFRFQGIEPLQYGSKFLILGGFIIVVVVAISGVIAVVLLGLDSCG
jgi:hypothetical protein